MAGLKIKTPGVSQGLKLYIAAKGSNIVYIKMDIAN
jgi:hypothetical protein